MEENKDNIENAPAVSKEVANALRLAPELSKGNQEGIVTELESTDELLLLKCPKCQAVHFRHAGYMHPLAKMDFVSASQTVETDITTTAVQVMICVNCKTSIINHAGKIKDVTKHVDLNAWEKTEKEAHKATGPGGEC